MSSPTIKTKNLVTAFALILVAGRTPWPAAGEETPSLQSSLRDTGLGAHWVYDDFEQARATARRQKKPLLVLFRCVP